MRSRVPCFRSGLTVGAALAVFATACATAPQPAVEWVKSQESAEDFQHADPECKERAFATTAAEYNQYTATQAAIGVYLKCMREKGWIQVQKSATPNS